MDKVKLKLFITGHTPQSLRALDIIKNICKSYYPGLYKLDIIDVLENPQQAEQDKILATPTLIKEIPPPIRRIIGDLSDKNKILSTLDLIPAGKDNLTADGKV